MAKDEAEAYFERGPEHLEDEDEGHEEVPE